MHRDNTQILAYNLNIHVKIRKELMIVSNGKHE